MFITLLGWAIFGLILAVAIDVSVSRNLKPTTATIVFNYLIAVIVTVFLSLIISYLLPAPGEAQPKVPTFVKIVMFGIGAIAPFIRRWSINLLKDRS